MYFGILKPPYNLHLNEMSGAEEKKKGHCRLKFQLNYQLFCKVVESQARIGEHLVLKLRKRSVAAEAK